MASKVSALRAHRQAVVTPLAALGLAVSVGVGVSAFGPGATPAWHAVAAASLPLLLLTTLAMIVAAVTVALSASLASAPALARVEEPLLLPPRLPMIRRDAPFIVVLGTAPKSGTTTLARNLAAIVATEGRSVRVPGHRPRPLCLLDWPDALDADGIGLAHYLTAHPTGLPDDVVDLAVPQSNGVEVLPIADGGPNAYQLRQLLPVLRRYYDLIVLDLKKEDHWLIDTALELADVILVTSLPTPGLQAAIAQWSNRIWALGFEGKSVLTLNRRSASDTPIPRYRFQFVLELPDDPAIAPPDGLRAAPMGSGSPAARRLQAAVHLLLPDLFAAGDR
ncbi:MAG: hypothetical protein QOH92_619 [Chloroflexota bacterium]|nr:hypothetical protein [Chloroflexota bacterium]